MLICEVCKKPQYITPSGACCENGHGGADGIYLNEPEPATDRPTTLTESARMMVDQHARDLADALFRFMLEAETVEGNIRAVSVTEISKSACDEYGRYLATLKMSGNYWQASGATVSDALANALQAYYLR